jgi:heat-inducible transcriptional repressor
MVVADELPEQIQQSIDRISVQGLAVVQELLINTSQLLAGLTQFASLVTAPKTSVSRLQHIEFIKISTDRILVILVTKSGLVKNRIIESQDQLSQEFLNLVSGFLNEQFKNHSLGEIRGKILQSMVEDKDRYNKLLAQAIRLGKKAFELDKPVELFIEGQTNLLMDRRFNEKSTLDSLVSAFDEKSSIVEILDKTMEGVGTRIYIGVENDLNGLQDCSLITACYGNKHNMLGTLGVIGPTSMDYRRIIPVVDYTAKVVSRTITSQSYD